MQKEKNILIGIDVEEFDIPEEYGQTVAKDVKIQVTKSGLGQLIPILNTNDVSATFFTTAFWAIQEPKIIQTLAQKHEIASHSFYHNSFNLNDLRTSKIELSKISGQDVIGIRLPRMKRISARDLLKAGYIYDSSLNPTYLPGRYNNFRKKRLTFKENGLIEIPVSVTRILRIPLFWLAFKNIPFSWYISLCKTILTNEDNLILYFHPWEFVSLDDFKLPNYVKRRSGTEMLENFEKLLKYLSHAGSFITHKSLLIQNSFI